MNADSGQKEVVLELGEEVRRRRSGLGLTLEALAGRSQVSRAMLSEIERGAKNPTIKVVCQIAEGLGCTVSQLLGEPGAERPLAELEIVRVTERRMLVDPRTRVERHLLSPRFLGRGVEILCYLIPPGAATGDFPPHRAGVEEHLTVVRGELRCRIGDEERWLAPGDSLSFRVDVPHGFHNSGNDACEYFLVIDSSQINSP